MRQNEEGEPDEEVGQHIGVFHPISTEEERFRRQGLHCAVVKIDAGCVQRLQPGRFLVFVHLEGVDLCSILSSNWVEHLKLIIGQDG